VDRIVGPVDRDERLAEIAHGRLTGVSDVPFRHHDPQRPAIPKDHLAVADLVLQPAEGMGADGVVADAQLRLLGHLDLGDDAADGRVPPGKRDAGGLADQAASSVTPDEIVRPQRLAVGERDVDASVVLRDAPLIEHLDGTCVQTARTRPDEVLVGTPLDNGDVDARQCQLAGQHLHSTPPHSHSIVPSDRNALNPERKFFCARRRTVPPIRQKLALLISNGNFDDLRLS
jgi:hypothetical protein